MSRRGLHVVEYRGQEGLEALEDEWRQLCAHMPDRSECHAYEVHRAFLRYFCPTPEASRYLLVKEGDRTRAICPLQTGHDIIFRRRVPIWSSPRHAHFQISDLIATEGEERSDILPAIVEYLNKHADHRHVLLIGRLPQSSSLWDGLRDWGPTRYQIEQSSQSNYFDCALPYETLCSRYAKRFHRNLRAHKKRLAALDDVRMVNAVTPEDVRAELEVFLDVEASGWKGTAGTASAIKLQPGLAGYYRELAATMHDTEDRCEINSLYVDGRCAASQFALRTGSRYSILKIGYDEEFARLGPGVLLFDATVERCCADPTIECLDLVSDSPWFKNWGTEKTPMAMAWLALGARGRLAVGALSFRLGPVHQMADHARAFRTKDRPTADGQDGGA